MRKDIAMKYNRRIFPVYKAFAWDALFYHAIIFLFLTQTRGLSVPTVLYAEAVYRIFLIVLQVPCGILIKKIGSRKALIIGNLLVALQIGLMIFVSNFVHLVAVFFICALGYGLKEIGQHKLIYDSVKSKKGKFSYASIDAKGSSFAYILEGITSLFTGFLFVISNYLPILMSSFMFMLSALIAYRFEEVESEDEEKITVKSAIKSMQQGLGHIARVQETQSLVLVHSNIWWFFSNGYYISKKLACRFTNESRVLWTIVWCVNNICRFCDSISRKIA
ncbi:MAG: MFS transporter [Oscillospiraceae bacterium]|nr:MFS transporter [Oscillospiraceae bacterium]